MTQNLARPVLIDAEFCNESHRFRPSSTSTRSSRNNARIVWEYKTIAGTKRICRNYQAKSRYVEMRLHIEKAGKKGRECAPGWRDGAGHRPRAVQAWAAAGVAAGGRWTMDSAAEFHAYEV